MLLINQICKIFLNFFVYYEKNRVKRTNFKAGDAAPYAYNDILEYPEDYDPWRFNYSGSGILIGGLLILGYGKKYNFDKFLNLFIKLIGLMKENI